LSDEIRSGDRVRVTGSLTGRERSKCLANTQPLGCSEKSTRCQTSASVPFHFFRTASFLCESRGGCSCNILCLLILPEHSISSIHFFDLLQNMRGPVPASPAQLAVVLFSFVAGANRPLNIVRSRSCYVYVNLCVGSLPWPKKSLFPQITEISWS
jgi:hypothetical protein